jgi:hypothetical protein
MSLPRPTMRILPCSSSDTPNGGTLWPTLIWPLITWVSVAAGLPVATGFILMP